METNDSIFLNHLKLSLIGRLKLSLFERITSSKNKIPETKALDGFVLHSYRKNQMVGKLYLALLSLNTCIKIDFDKTEKPDDISALLLSLENTPIEKPFFIESREQSENYPIGILGTIDKLKNGGYVYEIWILDEQSFPDQVLGYFEIRAKKEEPTPTFSVLSIDGWEHHDIENYSTIPLLDFALRGLNVIHKQRFENIFSIDKLSYLAKSGRVKLQEQSLLTPPKDREYDRLVVLAITGKISCTEAMISMNLIKPYDIDHCFNMPSDIIDNTIENEIKTNIAKLLLYWNGFNFIMSDDYASYLGFRKLNSNEVPSVILGDFPKELVRVIRIGGKELIPPVSAQMVDNNSAQSNELKSWLLDKKLRGNKTNDVRMKLFNLFIGFSRILQNQNVAEKKLHDFLKRYPVVIDPTIVEIRSEVSLGKQYRVDLLLDYNFVDKKILLIELERSDHKIFTKSGRLTAKTTHALQQVEDWLRFWRNNPSELPPGCDKAIVPDGVVVIGRSSNLSSEQKERLFHLNQYRHIKVITYDDLLDRIKNMIDSFDNT